MYKDNFYSVLEVSKDASKTEIRKKYLELAKIYHPDIYKGSDEKIKAINLAYLTLRDSEIRRIYDLWLVYQEIYKSKEIEPVSVANDADSDEVFLRPDFFVNQKINFVILAILISIICLIAGISDVDNIGIRDLVFGGAFATYFVFLIAFLHIA